MKSGQGDETQQQADYFASLESMEGIAAIAPAQQSQTAAQARWRLLRAIYPGVLVAGTIGVAATFLAQTYNSPVMLFALLLGMAFHFVHEDTRCKPGIEFASRTILRIGVALLGARITAAQISSLGLAPVLTIIAAVTTTMLFGLWLGRRMGLGSYFGVLSGGAVAICGASAALAISAALPKFTNKDRDTVLTVVGVTALSTIAMVLYPLVVKALGMSHAEAGMFLGGTIHDVAQVVGAGYIISQEAGEISTYIKLLRVAALIPVIFCISFILARIARESAQGGAPSFPLFLLVFAALVALNSLVAVPETVIKGATLVSSWCLVTAISALGIKTSLGDLVKVGWRPVGLLVAETLWIGALVLVVILSLR